jgi:hypothetical protein
MRKALGPVEGLMAHSPRYEAHLEAAWRDLAASVDALCGELKTAPPQARRKALTAVARAPREPPGLARLPVVDAIVGELREVPGSSFSGCFWPTSGLGRRRLPGSRSGRQERRPPCSSSSAISI